MEGGQKKKKVEELENRRQLRRQQRVLVRTDTKYTAHTDAVLILLSLATTRRFAFPLCTLLPGSRKAGFESNKLSQHFASSRKRA